ncbi:MAG: NifB/NifX family molybdenum-iron cluster-binding protein [Thermoguttaceae bacterium]
MTIAIPVTNGRLALHFGHCERFALVDVDDATRRLRGMTLLDAPPHEPGLLPSWLHQRGVDTVIAGGMGPRAQQLFAHAGINVILGAPAETPEALVSAYLAGTLQSGENICDH